MAAKHVFDDQFTFFLTVTLCHCVYCVALHELYHVIMYFVTNIKHLHFNIRLSIYSLSLRQMQIIVKAAPKFGLSDYVKIIVVRGSKFILRFGFALP